uniref:Cytochrome c oxidase assembly factor 3 n=1 Tax=Culicoides sonorensis TaxID=179676 RepID=A0A336LLT7_CULSO
MSENNLKDFKISGLPKGAKIRQSDIDFMKLIESQNLERVKKLQKTRKNNFLVGCILGGTVLSIYMYSMFTVKQETFLDDFEEPKKINLDTQ